MPAQPIYIDAEEEISELIERLRQTPAEDVPVVVPARSRIGQSRFNFRLLRDYAREFGKRISIVSPDPAVQQLAVESGFGAFAAIDEVGKPIEERELAMAGVGAVSAPASGHLPYEPVTAPATRTPKLTMTPHRKLPSTEAGGAWMVLYAGAALVALVALTLAAVLVPSASITLTARAQPLTDTSDVIAAPNSAPVRIRTVTASKDLSQQFPATGVKDTPAVAAKASETVTNTCPFSQWTLRQGQIVSTAPGGGGTQFVLQTNAVVVQGSPQAVDVWAVVPGAAENVGANTIQYINNDNTHGCVVVTNPNAASGGADEVKATFVSQSDLDGAKGSLATELQTSLLAQLSSQAGSSEKLADTVAYTNTFTADHAVNDNVKFFDATVHEVGNGAVYNVDDVKAALKADLGKHVPSGFALTDNPVQSDFHVSDSTADGHISFTGTAKGYIAPQLDFQKIRSRLLGLSTASARIYLQTLPIESASFSEKPFSLPLLPFLSSRINIKYVVDTSGATGGATPTS
ncbi:MAG TPA: baseplate J/gp47 family protein [Candidatus Dormibacteraeota bacterium]|nr:baseplate J/gp47 family protein [Candidatus Dormibacteraeota bacterium]